MALDPSRHPLRRDDFIGFIKNNQGGDRGKAVEIVATLHLTIECERVGVPEEGSVIVSTVFLRGDVGKRPRDRRGEMQSCECVERASKGDRWR